jgi:hypothetical protein
MHLCMDELRLLVAAIVFATPWLGWLRAWWHHRRRHVGCEGLRDGLSGGRTSETKR